MKVVNISTVDIGGAYKAVERITAAFKEKDCGIENVILLRNKVNPNSEGTVFCNTFFSRLLSKIKNFFNLIFYTYDGLDGGRFGTDIREDKLIQSGDVYVVHWVNSFLSPQNIEELASLGNPVIVMLHDMWHFTGGCHYDGYCGKYVTGCMGCPLMLGRHDKFVKRNLKDKEMLFRNRNIFVVAPGTWVAEEAKKSIPMKNTLIEVIPNCIDTDKYKPMNREEAMKTLEISPKAPVVLFIAMTSGAKNRTKGLNYLLDALEFLGKDEITLMVAGNVDPKDLEKVKQEKIVLGYLKDEGKIVAAYNAARVTVVTSTQETFSFVTCESMACGTPVTAFPIGGILDQIEHKKTGYLAQYEDPEDLAEGIRFCINNEETLGEEARKGAIRFSYEAVSSKWIEMYNHCISKSKGATD